MLTLEAPRTKTSINRYCKIKQQKNEINIIKNVIGIHSNIPECIYLKIQELLSNRQSVNTVLKWRTDDCCYWVNTTFIPELSNNKYQKFSVKTEFTSTSCINKITKLYRKLLDIEKQLNVKFAQKYLEGYLEEKAITFNELPSYFN